MNKEIQYLMLLFYYFFLIQLTSCAKHDPLTVLIVDKNRPQLLKDNYYTVRDGDTLASIAKRFDQDLSDLAILNLLESPFFVYPGDKLYLPVMRRTSQVYVAKKSFGIKKTNKWLWPLSGKVITKFNQGLIKNNGIDIAANAGSIIVAAAPGEVVYSGNKLKNYGNLIVIKHANDYITAYAHNRYLYVKRGDVVKEGQRIAEIGNSGTNKVKLHFEMRLKGKPINPLNYLS